AASQAAGCIITSDDDDPPPPPPPEYATVGATWQIVTSSGSQATCPPGFETAALFNVAVNPDGTPVSQCNSISHISNTCFIDLFDCVDKAGVSAPLPPTLYQTWVAIVSADAAGNILDTYATSLSAYLDVKEIDLDFNASIVTDGGYFAVDWELEAASNGAPVTCAQAASPFVTADVTVSGTMNYVETNPWPCDDHYGVTSVIPNGTYTVAVQAVDNLEGYLGAAPEYINQVIQGPNRVTDLGTATIVIEDL